MNYWTTKNGNKIAVEDIGAEHLSNILHMLKRDNQDMHFMRISDCIDENREQLNLILGESKFIKVMTVREKLEDDMMNQIIQMELDCYNGWCNEWDYMLQS